MSTTFEVPAIDKDLVQDAQRTNGIVYFCIVCWDFYPKMTHACKFDGPDDELVQEPEEQPLYGCVNCDRTITYPGLCDTCCNEGIGYCMNYGHQCSGLVGLDDGMYCPACRHALADTGSGT